MMSSGRVAEVDLVSCIAILVMLGVKGGGGSCSLACSWEEAKSSRHWAAQVASILGRCLRCILTSLLSVVWCESCEMEAYR